MSHIVHSVPGTAAAMSMSMSMSERKEVELHPDVNEVCQYLGKQRLAAHYSGIKLEPLKFRSDGILGRDGAVVLAQAKEDFRRFLSERRLLALSEYVSAVPRNDGESIADYAKRLQPPGYGLKWSGIDLGLIGNVVAHIMRIERDEADAAQDAEQERKAEERRQRAELVKQSAPDRESIRELLTIIERGEEGEKLLNQIGAALGRHRKAEEARKKLRDIFDDERRACASLGKRAPSRPKVPDAPDGALEFAAVVARASAPPRRDYAPIPKAKASLRGF